MVMAIAVVGFTPTVAEAKSTKTSITVTNKATGKKIGKKTSLMVYQKQQLKVMYGKKNITKKAKYKTSNQNVIINKKGTITAKTAGTCTVTITYKKKTKKINVTVLKSPTATPKKQLPKEEPSTEESSTEDTPLVKDYVESHKLDYNPHPECEHAWVPVFYADTYIPREKFGEMYKEHLYLAEISCNKCNTVASTNPVSVDDVLNYTTEDFNNSINCYIDRTVKTPKHTHEFIQFFGPVGFATGQYNGVWGIEKKCSIFNYSGD